MNFFSKLAGVDVSEGGGAGGGGGWFASLQEKAKEITEVYKRDLGEFAATVKKDAGEILEQHDLMHLDASEESKPSPLVATKSASGNLPAARSTPSRSLPAARTPTGCGPKLAALQESRITYTLDPEDEAAFVKFSAGFEVKDKTAQIAEVLKSSSALEAFHKELVPEQVSYKLFWCRYFFRAEALQAEEKRKEILLSASDNIFGADEEFEWDDEEENTEKAHAPALSHDKDTGITKKELAKHVPDTRHKEETKAHTVVPENDHRTPVSPAKVPDIHPVDSTSPVSSAQAGSVPTGTVASSSSDGKEMLHAGDVRAREDDPTPSEPSLRPSEELCQSEGPAQRVDESSAAGGEGQEDGKEKEGTHQGDKSQESSMPPSLVASMTILSATNSDSTRESSAVDTEASDSSSNSYVLSSKRQESTASNAPSEQEGGKAESQRKNKDDDWDDWE